MRKKNPTSISLVDSAILVGIGVVVGGVAYWLYNKSQASSSSVPVLTQTGTDYAGNPTYQGMTPGGVGVFQNTTPWALGPAAGA
jgi:hypothetical protein